MAKSRLVPFFIPLILLSICSLSFSRVQQEQEDLVEITFPGSGNAVQGLIQITGTANIADFQTYRLEFSTQNSASPSWFLIHQQSSPIVNGILGEWDTSVLTDGEYMLRLSVYTQTNELTTFLAENIRIRNYTAIETDTPTPTSENTEPVATPTISASPTPPPLATPTRLPPNPISINLSTLQNAAVVGTIIGAIGAVVIILYAGYRQKH